MFSNCLNDIAQVALTPARLRPSRNLAQQNPPIAQPNAYETTYAEWEAAAQEDIDATEDGRRKLSKLTKFLADKLEHQKLLNGKQQKPSKVQTDNQISKVAFRTVTNFPSITSMERKRFPNWSRRWLESINQTSWSEANKIAATVTKLDSTLKTVFETACAKHETQWMLQNQVDPETQEQYDTHTSTMSSTTIAVQQGAVYTPNLQVILGTTVKQVLEQIGSGHLLNILKDIKYIDTQDLLTHQRLFKDALEDFAMVNTTLTTTGLIDIFISSVPDSWRTRTTASLNFDSWDSVFEWALNEENRDKSIRKFSNPQDISVLTSTGQAHVANSEILNQLQALDQKLQRFISKGSIQAPTVRFEPQPQPSLNDMCVVDNARHLYPSKQTHTQTKSTEITKEYNTETVNELANSFRKRKLADQQNSKPDEEESSDEDESQLRQWPAPKTGKKSKHENSNRKPKLDTNIAEIVAATTEHLLKNQGLFLTPQQGHTTQTRTSQVPQRALFENEPKYEQILQAAVDKMQNQLTHQINALAQAQTPAEPKPTINGIAYNPAKRRYPLECSFCKYEVRFDSSGNPIQDKSKAYAKPEAYVGHNVGNCEKKRTNSKYKGLWCGFCPSLSHAYSNCTNPKKLPKNF